MFDANNFSGISPNIRAQLDKAYQDKQAMVEAAKIQQYSTAEYVAKHLYEQMLTYQANLPANDDVALQVVQFNQSTIILVNNIGYIGSNLVCFFGTDTAGKPLELIQHIHQLSFLLMVEPKPVQESDQCVPKRKIGFVGQVE